MTAPTKSDRRGDEITRIPLTRFHNNTGEILDLALRTNVTLTRHGRDQWTIMPADYVARLEAIAGNRIVDSMDRQHVYTADFDSSTRAMVEAQRPTPAEVVSDSWNDD